MESSQEVKEVAPIKPMTRRELTHLLSGRLRDKELSTKDFVAVARQLIDLKRWNQPKAETLDTEKGSDGFLEREFEG
jgi:hypothetical protein